MVSPEMSTPKDPAATSTMYDDARAARQHLRLERAARAAVSPAPSIRFEDYPREVGKREIRVTDAAQRLANALHLHLD